MIRPLPDNCPFKPLGAVLQQADLVSAEQIEIALREQTQDENLRLGKILVSHGWLKQETADFFAEQWPTIVSQKWKQPLGQYLKEAALLDEEQISTILEQQRQTGQLFGSLAVLNGWLKQTTVNFFLKYVASEQQSNWEENYAIENWDVSDTPEPQPTRNASPLTNQLYYPEIAQGLQREAVHWHIPVKSFKRRNFRDTIFIGLLVLLAIAGAFSIIFNLFLRSLEEKSFQRGNELFQKGIYFEAIAKYDELLKRDGNYYQAWTNRGYALAGLGKYQRMLGSCLSATIIEPKATYAWNCQGEALYNLKQYEEAIAAFDQAIALNPTDSVFWINRGESLLALKRTSEALAATNEALELLEQIKQVEGSEKIKREWSIALSNKGRVLWEKRRYKEALAAFDQALQYNRDYFPAQRGRGMALKRLGQFEQSLAEFGRILNGNKLTEAQEAQTRFYQGLTLCQMGEYREALAAFDEALKLKPDYEAAEKAISNCQKAKT